MNLIMRIIRVAQKYAIAEDQNSIEKIKVREMKISHENLNSDLKNSLLVSQGLVSSRNIDDNQGGSDSAVDRDTEGAIVSAEAVSNMNSAHRHHFSYKNPYARTKSTSNAIRPIHHQFKDARRKEERPERIVTTFRVQTASPIRLNMFK